MLRQPTHEDHQRQAAIELINIGNLQVGAGDKEGALMSYNEALDIWRKLADLYFLLPDYQRDFAATLAKIGGLKIGLSDKQGALETYQQKLKIDRQIVESKLDVKVADRNNISLDLLNIAPLQQQLGDDAGALANYQQSLQNDLFLARRQPYNYQLQRRVALTHESIGNLQARAGDVQRAKSSYIAASAAQQIVITVVSAFYLVNPADSKDGYVDEYGKGSRYALLANQLQRAASLAEAALKVDSSKSWLQVNRAHVYLFFGRYDDAKEIYLKQKEPVHSLDGKITVPDIIRDDFALFRKLGLSADAVDRMAMELGI
jgi:tetratricopeptide (TPR) repeat protein